MIMIGLDTNVLIRFLVQDDQRQSKKANQCIEKWIKTGELLWICQIVLCEIIWVLEKCYQLSREELISILSVLLRTKQIRIERSEVVEQALHDFTNNFKIGFSDCLIGRQNAYHECSYTYTFDKNAAKKLPEIFKLIL